MSVNKKKYIESPEILWELFEAYKKKVKDNPRFVHDFVGKDGTHVRKPLERPLTMEGFECYCMDNTRISYPDLSEYFEGKNLSYDAYFPTSARILREIRSDQLEGGMVGQFNPALVSKLNALQEVVNNINTNHNIQVLSIDPLNDTTDNSTTEDSQP